MPVRVGSRAAETPFDWEDPGTWDAVLQGVAHLAMTSGTPGSSIVGW